MELMLQRFDYIIDWVLAGWVIASFVVALTYLMCVLIERCLKYIEKRFYQ